MDLLNKAIYNNYSQFTDFYPENEKWFSDSMLESDNNDLYGRENW